MNAFKRFWLLLPGLLLLFVIGFGGKFLENSSVAWKKAYPVVPKIEYVLGAIILGVIIANTVKLPEWISKGAKYEIWLKTGIVLLGSQFLIANILKQGPRDFLLVAIEIVLSIAVMHLLGRLFKLGPKLASLLAVGSAICGVSAIVAAKGAIDADDDDAPLAIAAIIVSGTLALLTFPAIGHLLGMNDASFGYWAGLGVDNTAEVTATAGLWSEPAQHTAIQVKNLRNAAIGFVVLAYAFYWAKKGAAKNIERKGAFLWEKFPKFVLGFLLVSTIASFGAFTKTELVSLGNASKWCFLLTFAGVGLQADFRSMKQKYGVRPFLVGAMGEVAIAAITLAIVLVANHISPLQVASLK